jgi:hypothetical protein
MPKEKSNSAIAEKGPETKEARRFMNMSPNRIYYLRTREPGEDGKGPDFKFMPKAIIEALDTKEANYLASMSDIRDVTAGIPVEQSVAELQRQLAEAKKQNETLTAQNQALREQRPASKDTKALPVRAA